MNPNLVAYTHCYLDQVEVSLLSLYMTLKQHYFKVS